MDPHESQKSKTTYDFLYFFIGFFETINLHSVFPSSHFKRTGLSKSILSRSWYIGQNMRTHDKTIKVIVYIMILIVCTSFIKF